MSLPLIIISASCQVLSFVLLLVMFSADSDKYGHQKSLLSPHPFARRCLLGTFACLPKQVFSPRRAPVRYGTPGLLVSYWYRNRAE